METKSLYERLGGYDAIAAVVDNFLQRLLSDPQVGVYNDSKKRDRQLLVDYMCQVAGGPVVYTGRDMKIATQDWGSATVTGR